MKQVFHIISICVLALFVSGCPGKNGGGSATQEKKRQSRYPVDGLAPTTVVMRVNGKAVTKADYVSAYRLKDKIYRVANRIPLDAKNEKTASFARNNRARILGEIVRRELLRQEADRLGIVAPPEKVRKLEKAFTAKILHGKEPFEAVDRIFGAEAPFLRESIVMDVREDLCLRKSATNDLSKVTDAEIDAQIAENKAWNARADATNKVQRARAEQARRDILNGGYSGNVFANSSRSNRFAKVFASVTKRSADKAQQEGVGWQILDLAEALEEGEAFAMWLAQAKPGDVSEPLVMDDESVIAIIGVVGTYLDDDIDDGEMPTRQYELVRCVFDLYEKVENVDDRAGIAKEMLERRKNMAMMELGTRLTREAKIEFPLGQKIFRPRAKKKHNPNAKKKAAGKKGKQAAGNDVRSATDAAKPVGK